MSTTHATTAAAGATTQTQSGTTSAQNAKGENFEFPKPKKKFVPRQQTGQKKSKKQSAAEEAGAREPLHHLAHGVAGDGPTSVNVSDDGIRAEVHIGRSDRGRTLAGALLAQGSVSVSASYIVCAVRGRRRHRTAEKAAEWQSAFDRVNGFKDLTIVD